MTTPRMPSGPIPRIGHYERIPRALVACFTFLVVVDAMLSATTGPVWATVVVNMIILTAVAWPAVLPRACRSVDIRSGIAAASSISATVASLVWGSPATVGPGELTMLLVLLVLAARWCRPRSVVACCAAITMAVALAPFRFGTVGSDPLESTAGFAVVVALLASAAAATGSYLRSQDERRRQAMIDIRRSERFAIAADLHDFVAHHVTGILVQSQMARMLAASDSMRSAALLEEIERSAGEALDSMRNTVGILRDGHESTAGANAHAPSHDFRALPELTARFEATSSARVTLRGIDADVGDIPHVVQAAVFRVVQESLTNVRKHASSATEVEVGIEIDARVCRASVRDNGSPSRGSVRQPGYGLIGLRERVEALGGTFAACGGDGGVGWVVTAAIPCAAASTHSLRGRSVTHRT